MKIFQHYHISDWIWYKVPALILLESQAQGARTHPHHPWKSLPPSSAISVTIMSHSIYLAGLAYRETSLTLNCILARKSIKVTKSPLPTPYFWHKKASHPPPIRSGPKLGDKLSGYFWLPWLDARVQAKTLRAPLSKVTQMYWSLFVPKLITLLAGSLDQRT